jgi:hemoglobin/transferrin/lactoferrin receptor protein
MKILIFVSLFLLPILGFTQINEQDTLKELVISANKFWEKKSDIPRHIEIIKSNEIVNLNQANTADLLQSTSMAYVQKSQLGGGSPILRGFESNRILIVIDGIRLNNAIFRGGHLQNVLRIDQNLLERVEIIYGPGSVIYGSDALGGVIHFITKNPEFNSKITGSAYYRYASASGENTAHIQLQAGSKKWAYLIGISNSHFDDLQQGKNRANEIGNLGLRNYYQSRQNNIDLIVKNNDPSVQIGSAYSQIDILQKLLYKQKQWLTHTLNVQISTTGDIPRYDRLSEMTKDTPVFSEWYYGPEKRNLISYQLENTLKRFFADRFKIGASIQSIEESRITRNFNNVNRNYRVEKVQVYNIQLDLFKQIKKHEMRYGFELNYNDVQSTAHSINILNNTTKSISTRYPDGGSQMLNSGIYFSHSYEFNPKFIISDGIRFNHILLNSRFADKTFFSFLPNETTQKNSAICGSIGIVYLPEEKSKIYLNTATGFRAPNVDDLNKIFDSKSGKQLIVPNENLKSEKSWTTEIGYQFKIINKLEIGLNLYYTNLYDAIILKETKVNSLDSLVYDGKLTKVYSYTNSQSAKIYGTGIQVSYILLNNFKVDGSIQYTYGRIQGDSIMPLDHIPPVYGRLGFSYENKKINFQFWTMFNGKKDIKDYYLNGEDNLQYANANGLPSWFTLNTSVGRVLDKRNNFNLQLGIENILDSNYRLFASGISSAGRNYKICLRVRI